MSGQKISRRARFKRVLFIASKETLQFLAAELVSYLDVFSKKSPTNGPTERTSKKPEYLIARSQLSERGPLGFGPIQILMKFWDSWNSQLAIIARFVEFPGRSEAMAKWTYIMLFPPWESERFMKGIWFHLRALVGIPRLRFVTTVDGSEIRRSPVVAGSLSNYLQDVIHVRWLFK